LNQAVNIRLMVIDSCELDQPQEKQVAIDPMKGQNCHQVWEKVALYIHAYDCHGISNNYWAIVDNPEEIKDDIQALWPND